MSYTAQRLNLALAAMHFAIAAKDMEKAASHYLEAKHLSAAILAGTYE